MDGSFLSPEQRYIPVSNVYYQYANLFSFLGVDVWIRFLDGERKG